MASIVRFDRLVRLVLAVALVQSGALFGQAVSDTGVAGIAVLNRQVLTKNQVTNRISQLSRSDRAFQELSRDLGKKGFSAKTGNGNYFGLREKYQVGQEAASFELAVQDYGKPGSTEMGAIAVVTITSGQRKESYPFALVVSQGDYEGAKEYRWGGSGVLPANSWWSCFKARVRSKCVGTCITALATCAPTATTYAGYVACVVGTCGYCATKAAACCACDCGWSCSWAVGCCDR